MKDRPRWVEEECPGSGLIGAAPGQMMGVCPRCRKVKRTSPMGRVLPHDVSVLK